MIIFSFIIRTTANVINIYNYCHTEMTIQFFLINLKCKLAKIFIFLIKFIYNILCIITNYIEFEIFFFSSKQTFSNPIFFYLTIQNIEKHISKINKTQQN